MDSAMQHGDGLVMPGMAAPARVRRWPAADWLALGLGAALLAVPVLVDAWRAAGGGDADNQVPLVLMVAGWLFWRQRDAPVGGAARHPRLALAVMAGLLPVYVAVRIVALAPAEVVVAWAMLVLAGCAAVGVAALRRRWFPVLLLLALATPSNRLVLMLARPLRLGLAAAASALAGHLGIMAGSSGTMIQVDGYQLLVATACSGVNSLIGMAAVCLVYMHVRHGARPGAAALLVALMLPVAMAANLLRLLALIVATHALGADIAEAWVHPVIGFLAFGLAVLLLFAIDGARLALVRGKRWPLAEVQAAPEIAAPAPQMAAQMPRRRVLAGAVLGVAGGLGLALRPRAATAAWQGQPLGRLIPAQVAGWRAFGDDGEGAVATDDAGLTAGAYGAVIARLYHPPAGEAPPVLAVIAAATGQTGGLLVHRPESCYPGAGFAIVADRPQPIALGDGRSLAGRFLTARNGAHIEQVLYWIRVGPWFPVTALAEEAAAIRAAISSVGVSGVGADGVLVRLSVATADADAARAQLTRFAAALHAACAPAGRALLAGG